MKIDIRHDGDETLYEIWSAVPGADFYGIIYPDVSPSCFRVTTDTSRKRDVKPRHLHDYHLEVIAVKGTINANCEGDIVARTGVVWYCDLHPLDPNC